MSTTRQTTEQTLPQTKSKTVFSAFSALVVVHPTMFAFYSTHFPKALFVVPENVFLSLFQNPPSFYLFGSICCFNNFRSEERRVGKECRFHWLLYHLTRHG